MSTGSTPSECLRDSRRPPASYFNVSWTVVEGERWVVLNLTAPGKSLCFQCGNRACTDQRRLKSLTETLGSADDVNSTCARALACILGASTADSRQREGL